MSDVQGGAELHLLRTACAAARRSRVCVAGRPGSPLLDAAAAMGVPTDALDLGPKLGRRTAPAAALRFAAARRRLHARLRASRPGEWTVLQFKWEQLLWGGEVVPDRVALWEHGPIPAPVARTPIVRARLRRAFGRAGAVFAWSDPAAAAIVGLCGREPDRLRAGVDPARVRAALERRDATRARHLPAGGGPLVAYAGRLSRDKGVEHLLGALALLPSARAVVCGEGPDRDRLERLARDLGVAGRTTFAGFVDDPLPVLAAADVAVLVSTSAGEGRPLMAVEAAAVGTSVVGLAGTPALEALAREGLVRLAASTDAGPLAGVLSAAARAPRRAVPAPSWDDTAGELLRVLAR
jgi:glycosyltransferase involved in cell wall biosynthesis